jgi:hypothetical protein
MSEQSTGNGPPRVHLKEGGASQAKSDSPNLVEQLIGLRESRANRRKINRAQLRREIVTACGLGVALMKDEAMWHSFCLADWSGIRNPPQLFEQQKAVFFALKYMCGPGREAQSEASFYFGAVNALIRDGYLGEELYDAIERFGGLKKLNDERRARVESPYGKALAASAKLDLISAETAATTGSSIVKPPNHSYQEHPSKWQFNVKFPSYPRIFEVAGIPAVFLFEAQITKFGEKCEMNVLKFQRVVRKRRQRR